MGFLKFILILLLVFYGLKILWKFFAPFLAKYAARKMEKFVHKKFNGQQQQQAENDPKVGETVLENDTVAQKKSSNKVGEYIDFEEVD